MVYFNEMLCFNPLLCLITPIVAQFLHLYVHASPAHLWIPQLFTQCIPTIIYVTLMPIVCVLNSVFVFW